LLDFFAIFAAKGLKVNCEEYLSKCESVAKVLVKIARGIYVSQEERAKAFKDAIELFNYEKSQKVQ